MEKLLNLQDVMDVCRVGYPTLHRWRKSGAFPAPIGVGKLLWTERQITEWMDRRSAPVTSAVTTAGQRRRDKKAFEQRQAAASAALQRHATNR